MKFGKHDDNDIQAAHLNAVISPMLFRCEPDLASYIILRAHFFKLKSLHYLKVE